jgi:PAS domain S-box-containing protein
MNTKLPLPPTTATPLPDTSLLAGDGSATHLRILADLATDLLWSTDAQGRVSWANRRWTDYTGQVPTETGAPAWLDALHPADYMLARRHLQAADADVHPWHLEVRLRNAVGAYRWFRVQGQPMPNSGGQWLGAATDIEECKLAKAAQHDSEEHYQLLFQAIDQAFCIVEVLVDETQQPVDYRLLVTNPAFDRATGLHQAVGYCLQEVQPAHQAYWMALYGQVALTGEAQRFSQPAEQGASYEGYAFRLGDPAARKVALLFGDFTARLRTEQSLRESEDNYRTLFNSIDEGYFLCDVLFDEQGAPVDLFYLDANPAAMHLVKADFRGKRLREIDPAYEPYWSTIFGRVAQTGVSERLERYAEPDQKWYDFYVLKVGDVPSSRIAVVFKDITARKRREAHITFLASVQTDVSYLTTPDEILQVVGEKLSHYLELLACSFLDVDEAQECELVTRYIWQRTGTPDLRQVFRIPEYLTPEFVETSRAGLPTIINDTQADERVSASSFAQLGIGAFVGFPFHRLGAWKYYMAVAAPTARTWRADEIELLGELVHRLFPRLERARAEEALRQSEMLLQKAFSIDTVGLVFFTPAGRMTSANQAFGHMSGYSLEALSSLHWETLLAPEFWAATAHAVAELADQGETEPYEKQFVRPDGSYWWGLCAATRLTGKGPRAECVAFVIDISARKLAEEQLQAFTASLGELVAERTQALRESNELMQSAFDTSLVAISVLEAVRDAEGELEDFRLVFLNKELERQIGRTDMVGKCYGQEYPGIRVSGLFELMRTTVETGEPQHAEYFYPHEGFNRWYTSMFVKLNDGVVATSLDITLRKQAEEDQLLNFTLLQQAEEVAGLGSWSYELATGEFRWSAGMYQLLGLSLGSVLTPVRYLGLVVAEDRPAAKQLLRNLTATPASFEKTLRIRVADEVKTLRFSAVLVPDAQGQPLRLLGVVLDVSTVERLAAENLQMRLTQQHVRIEAVLEAQEEERRRLAESLHNGLGQLLFATKLQLNQLTAVPQLVSAPTLVTAQREADRLLSEAIRQTRTLSHELLPGVVAEFGLDAALQDICRDLNTPTLCWQCLVLLHKDYPLPLPLQVAVYRLAQELTQNVAKHAQARHATLEVETLPGWVLLHLEDDGRGFEPTAPTTGIGLKTLRHRVALLGGTAHLQSTVGQGTRLQLRIPFSPPA